ncbi:unnamed protein product [Mytilus coruscus]|uniref:Uncharacterized protein n=1 Tax=Mytilus coruscus TaxID=42192 RepID=A0A6J8AZM9_MYTCO|nr:unnamed protein product [Mytilus coruscus]
MKISRVPTCPTPRKFLWNDDSICKFQQALQLPSVTSQLDQFVHNNVYSLDQDGIDIAVNDFQSCINEAANIALKQRKVKVTGKKKKDKPWYNTLLHDLKKSLDHYSRVLSLNPFNKELRAKCFHLSKTYNKTRKEKRRNYFKDLMVKLENTSQSNPKAFWDIINTLKSSDQENKESGIDAESWLLHFKELNTVNNNKLNVNNEYWNALNLCKIPEGHSYLDCNITIFNTVPTEKINLNMCRYLLKVNRKTCKLALYGELGRFPLYIDIIMSMVKYWIRLYNDKPKDALLSGALAENITMIDNNQQCWLSCIKCILNECGLSHFYKNPKSIKIIFVSIEKVSSV